MLQPGGGGGPHTPHCSFLGLSLFLDGAAHPKGPAPQLLQIACSGSSRNLETEAQHAPRRSGIGKKKMGCRPAPPLHLPLYWSRRQIWMRLQGRGAMEEGSDDRSGGFGGCCHCWRNSLWLIHQDAVEAGGAPTGGGVNPSTDGGSCCGGGYKPLGEARDPRGPAMFPVIGVAPDEGAALLLLLAA